jgi:hypothetical protein
MTLGLMTRGRFETHMWLYWSMRTMCVGWGALIFKLILSFVGMHTLQYSILFLNLYAQPVSLVGAHASVRITS